MVYGRPPRGATIVKRGPRSAYATAQMIYGKPPRKPFTVDSGITDVHISARGQRINAKWTPDPKMETTSDITIGESKQKPISEPARPIDKKKTRISPANKGVSDKRKRVE